MRRRGGDGPHGSPGELSTGGLRIQNVSRFGDHGRR